MVDLSKYKKKPSSRGRLRIDSSKISITDINKLKSLPIVPYIEEGTEDNFYIEPIVIEYYIPKESRFAYETKYLYIELFDPEPLNDNQKLIMAHFKDLNGPIDVIEVMNTFPQFMIPIMNSYNLNMDLHEKASMEYKIALSGESPVAIRRALYINEVLRKKEPKLASLEVLGDYTTFNINWCIRYLNKNNITHTLEDKTVEYLIKLHHMKMEKENRAIDERFEILTSIYMEQAFPFDNELFDEDDEEDFYNL